MNRIVRTLIGVALVAAVALTGAAPASASTFPHPRAPRHTSIPACQPIVGDQEPVGYLFQTVTRFRFPIGRPFYVPVGQEGYYLAHSTRYVLVRACGPFGPGLGSPRNLLDRLLGNVEGRTVRVAL